MNLALVLEHSPEVIRKVELPPETIVLRRMRIFRKISRIDAGKAIDRSLKIIERFENGRGLLSIDKKKQLVRRYRYTWEEYLRLIGNPDELPNLPANSIYERSKIPRGQDRKYQKQITKAARVLKVLRHMQGWTQPEAALKCGWSRSCIDHIENGRVEICENKIAHILNSYGCKRHLYEELIEAPFLRDEVIAECFEIIKKIDNDKLRAVKGLLDNLR